MIPDWDSYLFLRVRILRMRTGAVINLGETDRQRLEALVADRNSAQKHVWRARIALVPTGTSKTCVWRWQERFMAEGVEGLLRDTETRARHRFERRVEGGRRGSRRRRTTRWLEARTPDAGAAAARGDALDDPGHGPGGRAGGLDRAGYLEVARAEPASLASVQAVEDRAFVEKLQDVVGLYVAPPAHAVVLSVDEKSQIQALDRTQPGLPLKKGRGPTMTHDYKRNGTTTLFAALNVLDGSVLGQTMQRHRHQEFIRFLDQIERDVPKGKGHPRHSRQLVHPHRAPETETRAKPTAKTAPAARPCPCCGRPMVRVAVWYHGQAPPEWPFWNDSS